MLGGQLRAVESAAAAEELAGTALLEAARQLRSAAVYDPELAGLDLLDAGAGGAAGTPPARTSRWTAQPSGHTLGAAAVPARRAHRTPARRIPAHRAH